jgi:dihydroxyacetone kinase-like predicted kinase
LTQPREGTVLTVIADFARETAHLVKTHGIEDLPALFSQALLAVRKSLRGTSEQLDDAARPVSSFER